MSAHASNTAFSYMIVNITMMKVNNRNDIVIN